MKLAIADGLPITARADELIELLSLNQVVVIAGETGSGKTTQLPKLALLAGAKKIVHTQPRRIAARSVAKRIASECEVELGAEVGYAVRFDDQSSTETKIRVATDGLLLSELANDPLLRRYDTVIIDEAHERSLAIDFLLGYLVKLADRRRDLRVVITSATIDVERFAKLFAVQGRVVPIVEVSGRSYPVEIRYRPLLESDASHLPEAVSEALTELPRDGDVLVFASGEREIRDIAEYLQGNWAKNYEILPLHGRMAAHDQQRIFAPDGRNRIVIATNVAETSLTVPRIRFVIDSGFARISRFSTRLKVQRLPIEPISQASAAQRAGRCGRVADGICIRLYSEEDFDGRSEFTDPEIQRTNLASVILRMAQLRLGPIEEFGFLDQPDSRAIASGKNLLNELGAFHEEQLTKLGKQMATLPVDPRMSRMLIEAARKDCLADVLVIVAALSIQDPRERPAEEREKADQLHRRFHSPISDFLSLLALWNYVQEQRDGLSHSKFRAMCRSEYLHYMRVREWQDVHAQLRQNVKEMKLPLSAAGADPDTIHQAMLVGLLSHTALRIDERRDYQGARGIEVVIWPGSGLAKKPPQWLMAADFLETSRVWAHTVAAIDPSWLEQAGAHLLKRQYSEPRWSKRRGTAVATMRATLYGLPVVTDRVVGLAKQDPALARELFIRHALVQGEWRSHHAFVQRNADTLAEVKELEERTRRRDLAASDEALYTFFAERIPDNVVSTRHFDSWWRREKAREPHLLDVSKTDLTRTLDRVEEDFPTSWTSQSEQYDVDYRFEPGHDHDGVQVTISLDQLASVEAEHFLWQVPGRRHELVTALIKSLPKSIRRNFSPAASHAEQLLSMLNPEGESLAQQMSALMSRTSPVMPEDFNWNAVPDHLRVTFAIEHEGKIVVRGKNLDQIKNDLTIQTNAMVRRNFAELESNGHKQWPMATLPREVSEGNKTAWPGLVDEGKSVGIQVFTSQEIRDVAMVRGTSRLMAFSLPDPSARLVKRLPMNQALMLSSATYKDAAALVHDAWLTALEHLVIRHGGPAWTEQDFERLRDQVREDMVPATENVLQHVLAALTLYARMGDGHLEAAEDVKAQLSWLLYPGFIRDMGFERLPRLSVYLGAASRRLNSLKNADVIYALEARYHDLTQDLTPLHLLTPEIAHARWALEELRVSWFAQDLRTSFSVSEKKVAAMLDAIAATMG